MLEQNAKKLLDLEETQYCETFELADHKSGVKILKF